MKTKILAFLVLCFATQAWTQDRRSSAPYLSGDTFRAYADFIIDETNLPFSPEEVTPGSTIFLKVDYMDRFFKEIHPRIPSRYILITHNGDHGIPGACAAMLDDDKLIGWFGQNTEGYIHPKLHPIPIGIANKYWGHGNTEVFDSVRSQLPGFAKKHLAYMNFNLGTYFHERSRVYNLFVNQPFCFASSHKGLDSYLAETASSKFVLSPRGNGLDCHRTWEVLYMGAIPIVRSSTADAMYEGLPVVIIQDWHEITQEFLEKKYEEMSKQTYQMEKIYADYWFTLIDSYRNL
jgi:hypothetical protein